MSVQAPFDVAVVTGMSGAGRSTAARALEDMGWFVIDNLPPVLVRETLVLARQSPDIARVAVVVDVRGKGFFRELDRVIRELPVDEYTVRTLFLEATDEALVRRFESSRRPHPLQGNQRIVDGLQAEREALAVLRGSADVVIDTSDINVHELRRKVEAAFPTDVEPLHATVMSFGFKYGIPVDADIVLDVRFLPNPHWDPALQPLTGEDAPVSDYVLAQPAVEPYLAAVLAMFDTMRSGYEDEGKRYVTIAVGCTGGKHRSVAMTREIARRLQQRSIPTLVVHRDRGRE